MAGLSIIDCWSELTQVKKFAHGSGVDVASCDIAFSVQLKNLRVTLDQNFTFNDHVKSVVKTSNFHIRALQHILPMLSRDVANTIACRIVSSRLDYCNLLLHRTSASNLAKLQHVQNACVVSSTTRRNHIQPVLKDLHWLPGAEISVQDWKKRLKGRIELSEMVAVELSDTEFFGLSHVFQILHTDPSGSGNEYLTFYIQTRSQRAKNDWMHAIRRSVSSLNLHRAARPFKYYHPGFLCKTDGVNGTRCSCCLNEPRVPSEGCRATTTLGDDWSTGWQVAKSNALFRETKIFRKPYFFSLVPHSTLDISSKNLVENRRFQASADKPSAIPVTCGRRPRMASPTLNRSQRDIVNAKFYTIASQPKPQLQRPLQATTQLFCKLNTKRSYNMVVNDGASSGPWAVYEKSSIFSKMRNFQREEHIKEFQNNSPASGYEEQNDEEEDDHYDKLQETCSRDKTNFVTCPGSLKLLSNADDVDPYHQIIQQLEIELRSHVQLLKGLSVVINIICKCQPNTTSADELNEELIFLPNVPKSPSSTTYSLDSSDFKSREPPEHKFEKNNNKTTELSNGYVFIVKDLAHDIRKSQTSSDDVIIASSLPAKALSDSAGSKDISITSNLNTIRCQQIMSQDANDAKGGCYRDQVVPDMPKGHLDNLNPRRSANTSKLKGKNTEQHVPSLASISQEISEDFHHHGHGDVERINLYYSGFSQRSEDAVKQPPDEAGIKTDFESADISELNWSSQNYEQDTRYVGERAFSHEKACELVVSLAAYQNSISEKAQPIIVHPWETVHTSPTSSDLVDLRET